MVISKKTPLVLVFAGPSGHGKTELARQLGHLLSLELEVVDCTNFTDRNEYSSISSIPSISWSISLNFIYWWLRLRGLEVEGLSSGFCKQFSL
jgi:hypothetical protein